MRVRTFVAAALALSLTGAAPQPPQRPAGPLDTPDDLSAALSFEDRILDHLHYGQVHEQYYNTPERIPGDIAFLVGENDSALYTGNYLAGESFRFALAQEKIAQLQALLHKKPKKDVLGRALGHDKQGQVDVEQVQAELAFWQEQQAAAKQRVDAVVAQFHILTNISENWYGNPDLRIGGKAVDGSSCDAQWSGENHPDTSGESECDESLPAEVAHDIESGEYQKGGWIDTGGGIITGGSTPANAPEPGLLFRYCSPTDAPWAFNAGRNPRYNRLAADLPWDNDGDGVIEEGEAQNCIGATSRDAYAGVTFGLATALDLVGPTDPAMAEQIAHDIMVMTDYAVKYYWTAPRSHGRVVVPEVWGGNSLDNTYQPDMFLQIPLHRLNMVQIARRAAEVAGTPEQQARYEVLWAEELATQAPNLWGEMLVDDLEPHGGYYKYHLHHMAFFNLIRLEDDPVLRAQFMFGMGQMDQVTRSHINAFYEGLTYALTGEQDRLDDAVLHHRQWLDYFANAEANDHYVRNSDRCGTQIECVPDYSRPVGVAGTDVEVDYGVYNEVPGTVESLVTGEPAKAPRLRAADPLPVAWRRPADFMWQKDPTILDGGPNNPRYSGPSADFLLPYWMIRYYSEVVQPAVTPFGTPATLTFR